MSIFIYQIFFKEDQKKYLDSSFIPYFNSVKDNWFEYGVFAREYALQTHKKSDYTAFLSWKFAQKTKLEGKNILRFMEENPGYDCYFINPFPELTYLYENVWLQGDSFHKGLLNITQDLFFEAGYNIDLSRLRNNKHNVLFANYWVGNQHFWEAYMNFTLPLYNLINKKLIEGNKIFLQVADSSRDRSVTSSFIPFIMERLFSTFLLLNKSFSTLSYQYSDEFMTTRGFSKEEISLLNMLEKFHEKEEEIIKSTGTSLEIRRATADLLMLLWKIRNEKNMILNSKLWRIFSNIKKIIFSFGKFFS
jgi:hypothetical protein